MTWTLESEICAAAGGGPLDRALVALGVCDEECRGCTIETEREWHRAGAETYALVAAITHSAGERTRLYLKACVALGDLSGVSRIVDEWIDRRAVVSAHGVSVPRLYAIHSGTLIEEYLPYMVLDLLHHRPRLSALLESLGSTAGVLTRLGFPAFAVNDWMSRGEDVVIVDFGQDLGPPGMTVRSHAAVLEELLRAVERHRIALNSSELQSVSRGFERTLSGDVGT